MTLSMKSLKVRAIWSFIWTVRLAERRIFPAIDIRRSGTRREEVLLSKEEAGYNLDHS